jgi:hypothetical protein
MKMRDAYLNCKCTKNNAQTKNNKTSIIFLTVKISILAMTHQQSDSTNMLRLPIELTGKKRRMPFEFVCELCAICRRLASVQKGNNRP